MVHTTVRPVDRLIEALKKDETKTLVTDSSITHIYLNTITVPGGEGQNDPLTLVWIVFPRDLVTLRACSVNKIGPANLLYETYSPKGALAMVNGGFYGFQGNNRETPIGLLISDGAQLSPPMPWKSGGFLVVSEKSDIEIVPIFQRDKLKNAKQALQSKPLLISDGKLAVKRDSKDQKFNRSAIGLTEEGNIVVATAVSPNMQAATLYDFGRFLALLRSVKGVKIQNALNLDGATDSHLYVESSGLHLGYGGSNYVPSALAIIPRQR